VWERSDVYGIWRWGRSRIWCCEEVVVVVIHVGRREEVIVVGVVVEVSDDEEAGIRKGSAPEGEAWLFAGWVLKGVDVMWRYVYD